MKKNFSPKTFCQSWSLGMFEDPSTSYPTSWIPATVPGAVQIDWAKAYNYPDYNKADNYKQYIWMEDMHWLYRCELDFPALQPGERLFFISGGIDYHFEIGTAKQILHHQEGMFTPVAIELPYNSKPGSELWVHVYPAPKAFLPDPDLDDFIAQQAQANHSCKPAASYGSEFNPRLIPLGIWQDTYLEIRSTCFFEQAAMDYALNETFDTATIDINYHVDGTQAGLQIHWDLSDQQGTIHCCTTIPVVNSLSNTVRTSFANPQLWWPHDQGEPFLYTSTMRLVDQEGTILDQKIQKIGFRQARLLLKHDSSNQAVNNSKGLNTNALQLEINGRKILAKGTNWLSPQIFPGLLDRASCQTQLSVVKNANLNLLSAGGGAPVMKESFFELCDEMGLMVWQEFPLAFSEYPDDPGFLAVLDQESRSIITKLQHHPAIVLWCAKHHHHLDAPSDELALPLDLLKNNCHRLDPKRPFLDSVPQSDLSINALASSTASKDHADLNNHFAEIRRQKGSSSTAVGWCLNKPNYSLVYKGTPKGIPGIH